MSKGLSQWFGNKSSQQTVPSLGVREIEVLRILWHKPHQSVQQVLEQIAEQQLSLSTLQSTLERLYRKNLVKREKQGRHYVYQAAISQSTIISQLMQDIASQISGGDKAPMISGFMQFIGDDNSASPNTKTEQESAVTPQVRPHLADNPKPKN
ncbi:hypothetical protein C2869_05475 [Saccharobesus litoralis]|uniref:Penicillinase repressor n=1 Tax=Saccharobesus litoralis TaxID=2172099 RepID=A0A2S0VXH6_9ALTE|nr:hypothetical protein C2869_05475 [Saccharobesus litoralis]